MPDDEKFHNIGTYERMVCSQSKEIVQDFWLPYLQNLHLHPSKCDQVWIMNMYVD